MEDIKKDNEEIDWDGKESKSFGVAQQQDVEWNYSTNGYEANSFNI